MTIRHTRGVARWICPRCEREFGKVNQAHVCVPGITVEELLSRHPGWVGEIYAAVLDRLRRVGPVHEDAVNVGVFLKSDRQIANSDRVCGPSSSRSFYPSGSRILASRDGCRPVLIA